MENKRSTRDLDTKSGDSDDKIKQEVENLAKKDKVTADDYKRLLDKYPNQEKLVDEIFRLNAKKYRKFRKVMRKLVQKLYEKHTIDQKPLHLILEYMLKKKKEHGWTDAYFDEFRRALGEKLTGQQTAFHFYSQEGINQSRINRVFGSPRVDYGELHIKDSEHPVLNDILALHEQTVSLHRAATMLSLLYTDCNLIAMTGEYRRERHIAQNFISPVLAAMFLPKFELFETQMIHSNFGEIVRSRHKKEPMLTEANNILFYEITTDPNDVVCETSSPITDIRNRFKVQIALWGIVQKLRNGNYYEAEPSSQFLNSLYACRNNFYDGAHMAYRQDEGGFLKRLLSVFSLRPTLIKINPINTIASFMARSPWCGNGLMFGGLQGVSQYVDAAGGLSFGNNAWNNAPIYTVTAIPFIEVSIPPNLTSNAEAVDIQSALTQSAWITGGKTIMPYQQEILYSKEVLIFYVNRRVGNVQITTYANPIRFSRLPTFVKSTETLNRYPISVPDAINIRHKDDTYYMRSVVAVTDAEITYGGKTQRMITGSTALIAEKHSPNIFTHQKYYMYDPLAPVIPVSYVDSAGKTVWTTNKPISTIPGIHTVDLATTGLSFYDRAMETATILIYAKDSYDFNEAITI